MCTPSDVAQASAGDVNWPNVLFASRDLEAVVAEAVRKLERVVRELAGSPGVRHEVAKLALADATALLARVRSLRQRVELRALEAGALTPTHAPPAPHHPPRG